MHRQGRRLHFFSMRPLYDHQRRAITPPPMRRLSGNLARIGRARKGYGGVEVLTPIISDHHHQPWPFARPGRCSAPVARRKGVPHTLRSDSVFCYVTQLLYVPPIFPLDYQERADSNRARPCQSIVDGSRRYPTRSSFGRQDGVYGS